MKVFFLRLISIGIIVGILFVNLRTLYAFLRGKDVKESGVSLLRTITGEENKGNSGASSLGHIKKERPLCQPITAQVLSTNNHKKIVLRLDDIGASTPLGILKKFIVDTERYHAPLVLGIIPEGIETNTELSHFLESESCNLEFAIHGWDHFSAQTTTGDIRLISEFSEISAEDAEMRIKKAQNALNTITDEKIITFIPPYSSISQSGILAAKKMGIQVISSIGSGTFDAQIMENRGEERRKFSKSVVLKGCENSFEKTDVCVIAIRLEDFLTESKNELDETIYYQYLGLLEEFSNNGEEFTTFSRLQKSWPDFFQYSLIQ